MAKKIKKLLKYSIEYIVHPEHSGIEEVLDRAREDGEANVVDVDIIEREVV